MIELQGKYATAKVFTVTDFRNPKKRGNIK